MRDEIVQSQQTESNSSTGTIRKIISQYTTRFKNRSVIVDVLLIFFGIGSWIGINSTFLQVPLFVNNAPEGWRLPSFITISIQFGNIGPISYTLLQKFSRRSFSDTNMIYCLTFIGTVSSLLMAFLYDKTTTIGNAEYSLPLLILVFFLAIVGCTSSVLFMPYMGRFKEIYLVTYLIGEGVSGLVPSIVALIQGVGASTECVLINGTNPPEYEPFTPPPNFTTTEFFIFVFSVMLCSLLAFLMLEKLSLCKREYAENVKIGYGNTYEYVEVHENSNENQNEVNRLPEKRFKQILVLLAIISFIGNGILPSIQSFSCMPYGNNVYHLTVSLTLIANPVSCLLAIFLPHSSIRLILSLIACFCMTATYITTLALMSPYPVLVGSNFGGVLIIIIWTIHIGVFSYIKLCITTLMRAQGGNSLVWTGGIAQAGTAAGSIFIFVLVNFTKLFTSANQC